MTTRLDERWMKVESQILAPIPYPIPVKMNHHQFLVFAGRRDKNKNSGVIMYDTHTDQWSQIAIPLKRFHHHINYSAAFNKYQNKVYFWFRDFLTFDTKTRQFSRNGINAQDPDLRIDRNGASVNEYIHFIGTKGDKVQHVILNTRDNTMQIFNPTEFEELEESIDPCCIYVKSKHMLLVIGGRMDRGGNLDVALFAIWKYCLKKKQWSQVTELAFDLKYVTCQLSANEKYVIISGGVDRDNTGELMDNDKIFVLDITTDDYKLRECNMKMPRAQSWPRPEILLLGGEIEHELLVIGWIKKLFETKEFENLTLPPMYILKMIGLWYNQEELHWMHYEKHNEESDHHIMTLNQILSSLK